MATPKRPGRQPRAAVQWKKDKPGRGTTTTRRRGARAAAKPPTPAEAAPAPADAPTPADVTASDPSLFAPLTPGETADAIRTLTEDRRVAAMAKIGRYRVIATEPLVVKPPHWMTGHRLARVVVYDYAADRCVDACVDLDAGVVAHLDVSKAQPMLSRDEESEAISVAKRSAAVVFGQQGGHPSLVAVVDLIDNQVTAVVPAAQW